MSLINESPGAFIALAATVLYSVVAAEIWMWTAASIVAVAVVFAAIIAIAGALGAGVLRLMEDEDGAQAPAPTPAPRTTAPARPVRRAGTGRHGPIAGSPA